MFGNYDHLVSLVLSLQNVLVHRRAVNYTVQCGADLISTISIVNQDVRKFPTLDKSCLINTSCLGAALQARITNTPQYTLFQLRVVRRERSGCTLFRVDDPINYW